MRAADAPYHVAVPCVSVLQPLCFDKSGVSLDNQEGRGAIPTQKQLHC